MTFAEKLTAERIKKGVSQTEVAKSVGVTQNAISYFENGFKKPSIDVVRRIAKYFEVSLDYLLGDE